MASACRSAAMIGRRSLCSRPNTIINIISPNHKYAAVLSSSTSQSPFAASRFTSILGSLETMLPLHSAIAVARLKSKIAVDTTCWSLLSQDCNSSVNNDADNLASVNGGLNQEGLSSASSVILLVLTFSIFWFEGCNREQTCKEEVLAVILQLQGGLICIYSCKKIELGMLWERI